MKKVRINSKEISVIVRGLVTGQDEGNYKNKFTKRSLESVRRVLPQAQIILSTYVGSDVSGLDYDHLVLNHEPEKVYMLRADGTRKFIATNNQIVTTRNALENVERPYVLSMRTDVVLTDQKFLQYFEKYNQNSPKDILEKKVVTLPTYNPRRSMKPFLFNVCDWFYFGTTKDITNIFTIPLIQNSALKNEGEDTLPYITDNLESEQYIWTSFLKKNGYPADISRLNQYDKKLLESSEQSYARYTIMLPAHMAGVICLKMPRAGYGARPWLSQGLYTWNEYKRLYTKYNSDHITIIPNPVESISYSFIFWIRKTLRREFPYLYKKIVNAIRKLHGSTNLIP